MQEKEKLHSTIWKIANELRGSVDGWDFKQYVLGMLFYRFISENITNYVNNRNSSYDYINMSDEHAANGKQSLVTTKGFFILPSQLFENIRKNSNDENLNENLNNAFKAIEKSSTESQEGANLKGLFDDIDTSSNKLGATVIDRNKKLKSLMSAISELDLGDYHDLNTDLFGDAYEYLMTMYAASAGKSGGEFFTPQEVSELLAKITVVGKKEVQSVYDPACGSGSLLLKFAKVLGKDNIRYYGQEINITTYNLCRINMFLHNINFSNFEITHGNTLTHPQHDEGKQFEAIVSNPPYSIKWEGSDSPIIQSNPRFKPPGVLAPKSKADLAFVMHALHHLAPSGVAAIVSFPGVMYRSGAEQKIRKYLVDNNYIDAIIQLPKDLFFGTSIATCILVLKKSRQEDEKIMFIDANLEFNKGNAKNLLSQINIENILNAYANKSIKDHFSYLASRQEVAKNDYNLSVNSYVELKDTSEKINITELNQSIKEIVAKQSKLREQIEAIVSGLESNE